MNFKLKLYIYNQRLQTSFQPNVRDKLSPLEVQMRYDISSKSESTSTDEATKQDGALIPVNITYPQHCLFSV